YERTAPQIETLKQTTRAGDWVLKLLFKGSAASDNFEIRTVIGELASTDFEIAPATADDNRPSILAPTSTAFIGDLQFGYRKGSHELAIVEACHDFRKTSKWVHGQQMKLHQPHVSADEVETAVSQL